jgi:calcineurin B family protein 1
MGSRASSSLREEEIQEIHRETGFTSNQIIRLYSRFTSLDKDNSGFLQKEDFMRIPELAINPLAARIINLFCTQSPDEDPTTPTTKLDKQMMRENPDQLETVNFRQFMRVLARFRPVKAKGANELNSRLEKLKFAFNMYDLDCDDKISRSELLSVLHMMVGANISEEQLGSIADRTIMEADEDQDGAISFAEFVKVMEKVDVEQKMSIRFLN